MLIGCLKMKIQTLLRILAHLAIPFPEMRQLLLVVMLRLSRNSVLILICLAVLVLHSQQGKKKLTTHWRNFIRPLMWRCKWTELKIRELDSQALKHTRELEANDQPKTLEPRQDTSDFGSKFSKPMKRRKRIRVENVTDVSSYISQHHLFSYFVAENKKPDADGAATSEDDGNQGPVVMEDLHGGRNNTASNFPTGDS